VYFCGHNSVGFQLLSMVHPKLRTASLLQEFLQQEGKTVEVRVGSAIENDAIAALNTDREATEYLRGRTYLLGRRGKPELSRLMAVRSKIALKPQESVAAASNQELLVAEIAGLEASRCLAENADFAVYLGTSRELPQVVREIGRLRELTFRKVGEGTGKSRDL